MSIAGRTFTVTLSVAHIYTDWPDHCWIEGPLGIGMMVKVKAVEKYMAGQQQEALPL